MIFRKLLKTEGRGSRAYKEAVEATWKQWIQQAPGIYQGLVEPDNFVEAVNSLAYRRLISEFWVAVIAEETPWERLDLQAMFSSEKQVRQQVADQVTHALFSSGWTSLHTGLQMAFAPLFEAHRTLPEEEFVRFVGYEYLSALVVNIALQQVPLWRHQVNDRNGWTNEDLQEFFQVHDGLAARHLASYKTTVGWDEIAVHMKLKE